MRSFLLAVALTGALGLALAITLTTNEPVVDAAPGKNLKIYPKTTDTAQIKKDMKLVAKSLGVQCDHCHDVEDFSKDSNEHKEKARQMMRMVGTINAGLKKDGFKETVNCNTCHRGAEKPKK
ncbi:MAG TPA: c-type cytochrome [Kofleriaceae bacterium]|nr:c-type cytochrome [Kofleriaceae bacterium]